MEGRRELFRINLKSLELGEGVDFDELATKAAGYSGADVANVCRCAFCCLHLLQVRAEVANAIPRRACAVGCIVILLL
jgi:ATP-dependent 26S proteasome regulatory subunit